MTKYQMMTIIGIRSLKGKLVDELMNLGAVVINSTYGKSLVRDSNFFVSLGFSNDPEKILITCLVKITQVQEVYRILNEKYKFNQQNTGIAFCTKVRDITV